MMHGQQNIKIIDSCLSAHYFMRTTKNIPKCVAVFIVIVLET